MEVGVLLRKAEALGSDQDLLLGWRTIGQGEGCVHGERESMNSDLDLLSHKELEVIQRSRDHWPDRQCSGAWSWLKVT